MYNSDDVYDSEDRTVWSVRNILLSIIGLAIVVFVPRIYSFSCSVDLITALTKGQVCSQRVESEMVGLWTGHASHQYHTSYNPDWETHRVWAKKGQTIEIQYQVIVEKGDISVWVWDTRPTNLYKGGSLYTWRKNFVPGSDSQTVRVTAPYTGSHEVVIDPGLLTDGSIDLAWRVQ